MDHGRTAEKGVQVPAGAVVLGSVVGIALLQVR